MPLNKSKGNMYPWITHTWNPLGGECPHKCSYCSTNKLMRYPPVKTKYTGEPRLIERELKTNLGEGNFIFVCAQNDLFAEEISYSSIRDIIDYCKKFDNKYLLQTKNPERAFDLKNLFNDFHENRFQICITFETNRFYPEIMNKCPHPLKRIKTFHLLGFASIKRYITIEPIMDFDLDEMVSNIQNTHPVQVNIGADSGNNNLPEPSKEKTLALIKQLEQFTSVKIKDNLNRIIK